MGLAYNNRTEGSWSVGGGYYAKTLSRPYLARTISVAQQYQQYQGRHLSC